MIASKLEAVERGEIKRLMILTPPRHGKTLLGSIMFPAWYLGRNPKHQVICASYNSTLATQFGRAVRNTIQSSQYRALFNTAIAQDSKSADLWHTSEGGVFLSAGVGGASTGFGANLFLVDDPIRSRADADSATYRDALWDWYQSVARTRLMPDGAFVWTYTPWHEDDAGQRLLELAELGGEKWDVLRLPANAEENDPLGRTEGEALWPAWYDETALREIKASISGREWSALYQCRPQPEGGTYFERGWFDFYDELPRPIRYYLVSDFAVSALEASDYTCHSVWGVGEDGKTCCVEVWRQKAEPDKSIEVAVDMILQYKPAAWVNEKGVIRRSLGPLIDRRLKERGVFCRMVDYARTVDKMAACRSFQGRMSMGMVLWPRTAQWFPECQQEMLSFPAGKHDDFVDTCALLGMHLEEVARPQRKRGAASPRARMDFDPLGG